ncbi:hypothetical protein Syun_029784 [Stephania yunnanensis]|uniref:Cathepsin propeptide inhibitor domain-containing protein n=1 Tax=Stephania yunnanensis TaxID=152371 RepID=A0AAP0HLP1_9MAGN
MAPPTLSKITLLSLSLSLSLLVCSALASHFSIVGYSPEDLTSIDKLINLFESWMAKHGKSYESIEEKLHGFEVFKDNLEHIDETDKKVSSYWLGLNEFADLSHEEFKERYLGLTADLSNKRDRRHSRSQRVQVREMLKCPSQWIGEKKVL